MRESFAVEIDWCGFQLHPEIPPGGLELEELFGRRVDRMRARIEAFAAEMGVTLAAPSRAPSTIAPLAATEFARDQGALEAMRDHLMDDHWLRGLDIEASDVLAGAGSAVGLDPDAVSSAATDESYIARVSEARDRAHKNNVTAIPTLLVRGFPIVGCQPWDVYDKVLTRLDIARR